MRAITGRIDLCHANDSRDPPGTGADRHANLGAGEMDPDSLRQMIRACDAPVLVETPAAGHPADLEFVREALG
jgi:deoxyribonuclease IV